MCLIEQGLVINFGRSNLATAPMVDLTLDMASEALS